MAAGCEEIVPAGRNVPGDPLVATKDLDRPHLCPGGSHNAKSFARSRSRLFRVSVTKALRHPTPNIRWPLVNELALPTTDEATIVRREPQSTNAEQIL